MSRQTHIPISTLFDKLKAHEKDIILKHTTIIDFSHIGYDTKVQFLIRAPSTIRDRLRSHLSSLQEVNTVLGITNGFDFLVEGIFQKVADAHHFKNNLEKNFSEIECHTHFVVEDIKREGFFAA
ncbi:MAG: Lrp/AsnC family transcriptional regulator [Nanoarchaeota archaeon]|nr:Lrp/AsnC family transcriptional regulator [Nanoarchaeota archaeon]